MKKKKDWIDPELSEASNNPFAVLGNLTNLPSGPKNKENKENKPADNNPVAGLKIPKKATVRVEKKGRGGKTITRIVNLELSKKDLKSWCVSLRKSLGCGGVVEGYSLVMQGDQRSSIAEIMGRYKVKVN